MATGRKSREKERNAGHLFDQLLELGVDDLDVEHVCCHMMLDQLRDSHFQVDPNLSCRASRALSGALAATSSQHKHLVREKSTSHLLPFLIVVG